MRGAAGVVTDVPKAAAINAARIAQSVRTAFDRIDAGEKIEPFEFPIAVQSVIQRYQGAGPEQRAQMREQFPAPGDPRQTGLYQFGKRAQVAVEEAFPVNPAYEKNWEQQLARGIGSGVGFMALGVTGRAAGLPPAVSVAVPGAAVQQHQHFMDALSHGASLEDAYKAADLGTLSGATEAVPIARVLDRFDKATGGSIKRIVIEGMKGGIEEGLQETFQNVFQNLVASDIVKYDPERKMFEGVGPAAWSGFTVGALFSTVASMLGVRVRQAQQEEAAKPKERIEPRLDTSKLVPEFPGDRPPPTGVGVSDIPFEGYTPPRREVPAPAPAPRIRTPITLTQWLKSVGGVKDQGGELRHMGLLAKTRPGFINNRAGMTLDNAALSAWEAGFFPEMGERRPTINEFLEALREDFAKRTPRYLPGREPDSETLEWERQVVTEADRLGISVAGRDLEEVWEEVNSALAEGAGAMAMARQIPPKPKTEMTEQGEQYVIEGTEQETPGQVAARERQWQKEEAEARMRGKARPGVPQERPGGLFGEDQGKLFSREPTYRAGPGEQYVPLVEQKEEGQEPRLPAEGAQPTTITRESILQPLIADLGLPLYQGRIKRRGPLGFARKGTHEVRVKRDADIEVAAHEFAHVLDMRYPEIRKQWLPAKKANKTFRDELRGVSYDKKKLYEGWAEFVRLWATQKDEARKRAPTVYDWFEGFIDRTPHAGALRKAQEGFHAWFAQDQLTRARSKVGLNENVNAALGRTSDRMRQAVFDDLQGVLVAEREIFGGKVEGGGYETARLARSSKSIADGAVKWGAPKVVADGRIAFIDASGNTSTLVRERKGGGLEVASNPAYKPWGLENIMAPVADRLADFGMYAVGRRAQRLMEQGRENLFTRAEIKAMLALETPAFKKAFADWNRFNSQLLDFAQDFGSVINPMGRSRWETDVYLPFWRVSHEAGEMRPGKDKGGAIDLIKKLHGGTENIGDPIENMFRNVQMLVEASITANARRAVVDEIRKSEGSARFLVGIPKEDRAVRVSTEEVLRKFWGGLGINYGLIKRGVIPEGVSPEVIEVLNEAFEQHGAFMQFVMHGQSPVGNTVIAVMRKGKPEYYEVADPLLFRALASLPRRPIAMPMLNWLRTFRRVGQATVTYAFDFWYRNIVRDQFMAATLSRHGYKPFVGAARGLAHRAAADAVYREYIANGGGLASFYSDDASIHRELETFYKKHGLAYGAVVNSPRKFLRMLERFADSFEVATRLGYFERALASGETPRQAAYLSREISTDFAMRGGGLPAGHPMAGGWDYLSSTLGVLYDSVIFLKAGIVGMDRVYRGFRNDPNRTAIAAKTGGIALAGLALHVLNSGNPLYDDLPDWDRDAHWHVFIPNYSAPADAPLKERFHHFRLPKPWEIGGIASIVERAWDSTEKGAGETTEAVMRIAREMFRFEFLPQAIQPLYEQATNRIQYFDRPIEGMGEQSLPPWMRSRGTSQTMRAVGERVIRHLPRGAQISPSRLEALLKGYFHTAAIYGLTLSDAVFFDDSPDIRIDQYPLIRSIYSRQPRSKYQTELYDMLRSATEARRAMRELYRQHENELAGREALSVENLQYGRLNAAAHAFRAMTALQRRIADARSPDQLAEIARGLESSPIPKSALRGAMKSRADTGAMKRILIDAVTDLKNATAKLAVEGARDIEERAPAIRKQVAPSLPATVQ